MRSSSSRRPGSWPEGDRECQEPAMGGGKRDHERGPDQDLVEYLVLRTPDLASIEQIAPGLRRLVETSQLAVLDLVGVQTDAWGAYQVVDLDWLPQNHLRNLDVGGVLSEDDI